MQNRLMILPVMLFTSHCYAQVPIEIDALNFGDIPIESGSVCTLDNTGNIVGSCDASSPDISLGRILVESLPKNTEMFISVAGSNSANLSLLVSGQVTAASQTTTFTDGEQIQIRSRGSNNTADILIGGEIRTLQTLTNGQSYQIGYTVTINIQ
ncbi:hypothetical protein [Agaribacter flavus]|uniref:DUF4402 domain-containing protein n=1 Tax=Agaribacter flavus TaxID=1902781 RepID=A0ABV7FMB1_9ALTE